MENYTTGNLVINITEGDPVSMTWLGRSDDRTPSDTLLPYLQKIADHYKGKTLDIRFEKLDYMNSSSVPPIIMFVKLLHKNEVKTNIFYDGECEWQAASFKALETIAMPLSTITIKPV
jgi:hypothetical protein